MNIQNTQSKIINGKTVRRSTTWPNYGCTSCGIVYRWDREKKMTSTVTQYGYLSFRASHNNFTSTGFVHVIVAQCWLDNDNPTIKVNVNHIDGNKANPNSSNLEWVTRSQNQRHAIETNLKSSGEDLYNSQLTEIQVHEVCVLMLDGWRAKDIAERYNVSVDIISKIKSGDSYPDIRNKYNIPVKFKDQFSESTVRWVCEQIVNGTADATIATISTNKKLSVYQVKRIRNKIRYSSISNEYF